MTTVPYTEETLRSLVELIEQAGKCRPFTGFAVSLPPPPSANRIWRVFGNRVHRSQHYIEWLEHCDYLCRHQSIGYRRFTVPVQVTFQVQGGKGFPESRDLDNCLKPVIDLLRKAELMADDNVRRLSLIVLEYRAPGKGRNRGDAVCRVIVEERR